MGEESPKAASTPTGAVFLSYASQDAEATQRICAALRSAGVEVWFDQSELRGGDAWDQSIRKQIKTCALFIPIISQHTHDRAEGYFRLEWKLAVDRSHLIMANKAFLVPVVIDQTADDEENLPDKFREVQWTRLPAGETPPGFVARVQRLLSGESSPSQREVWRPAAAISGKSSRQKLVGVALIVALVALAYLFVERPWAAKSPTAAVFAPPPHSIAVLPFVNLSGDKEQEYLSDGLTEELLNSLAEINELQVAARTSSFYFKGTNSDTGTIARKLNVGAILEGSVRRSGNTVRITAQLIDAVTGFHLWSHTYDRDLGDVLRLETEIAGAVASALKVRLLEDLATKIEFGGTHNSAAFDAYLRGRRADLAAHSNEELEIAIADYTDAIRLDSNFALAFANRSLALGNYADKASGPAVRESLEKAQADARRAIALAPDLAAGHLALAAYFEGSLDFIPASEEYARALAIAPGDVRVLRDYGKFVTLMGHKEKGVGAARRAIVLDPLDRDARGTLGTVLFRAREYNEAIAVLDEALALDPDDVISRGFRGLSYYVLGDFQNARQSCEWKSYDLYLRQCLALVDKKLGRQADADARLTEIRAQGDDAAYEYAELYAQWGDRANALKWLDTAVRSRDSGLIELKTDPLMDPLRREPRFQAVMREMNFPD